MATHASFETQIKAWPEPRFWWLQIIGWLAYPIFIHVAYTPTDQHTTTWGLLPGYYAWEALLGFSLSLVLREVQRRLWHKPIWLAMTISILSVALAAEVWTLGKLVVYYEFFPYIHYKDFWKAAAEWYPNSLTVLAAWFAIYYGFKHRSTLVERERTLLTAQAAAKESQLRMLRYQLNPHFLFNTLANVCALISDSQPVLAKKMTMQLSEFLRYSLDSDPLLANTLEDEVEVLKLYFNIEKIRYANRLNYQLCIPPETYHCRVPSMLLQPLVENSIKHAIAPSVSGGTIIVAAAIAKDSLVLSVRDDGPGQQSPDKKDHRVGIGIGIRNTTERLTSLYGNKHSLELLDVESHGFEVRISIPLAFTRGDSDD